eukprot:GILI01017442.1.p1 GENE.GILI01017442.1~~GILI01017442.1.p1  ORF type:complete len:551 (-),score=74.39 GILI01017442.1:165-1817(-)
MTKYFEFYISSIVIASLCFISTAFRPPKYNGALPLDDLKILSQTLNNDSPTQPILPIDYSKLRVNENAPLRRAFDGASAGATSNLVPTLNLLANQLSFSGLMAARGPTLQDGDILASLGYGYSDMLGTVPNDPNTTRFPIASNTKLMTSTLIFILQEQGHLNISDNIADHLTTEDFRRWGLPSMTKFCMTLPSDPSKACQVITFEMLMGMTAGIVGSTYQIISTFVPMYVNISMMFGLLYPMMSLSFVPGTDYHYSNQNYYLLGYFIEKYTGMELGAAYKKYIFDPLCMKDSYFDRLNGLFQFDPLRTESGFRYFLYDQPTNTLNGQLGTGKCQNDLDLGTAQGAGGVVSTLKDEAILYYCLFDMQYGDDTPNPHCPFNSSLASPMTTNAFNILSMASRKKILAPYAYQGDSPQFGTVYYSMGLLVTNNTGPYSSDLDAGIVVRGPPISGPSVGSATVVYPNYIQYTGALLCVNTANLLSYTDRVTGSIRFFTQSFEAHRSMATPNPNSIANGQSNQQVSFYSLPSDMFAAYDATQVAVFIAQQINGNIW